MQMSVLEPVRRRRSRFIIFRRRRSVWIDLRGLARV
jgi:hypothetical protein